MSTYLDTRFVERYDLLGNSVDSCVCVFVCVCVCVCVLTRSLQGTVSDKRQPELNIYN